MTGHGKNWAEKIVPDILPPLPPCYNRKGMKESTAILNKTSDFFLNVFIYKTTVLVPYVKLYSWIIHA